MENPAEFGRRRRSENLNGSHAETSRTRPFEEDRPMFEQLQDKVMHELLLHLDQIRAFQESGNGTLDDAKQREKTEQQIRDRYAALTGH